MTPPASIFLYYDKTDLARIPITVCVVNEKGEVRAHLAQETGRHPTDYNDFLTLYRDKQVILSVKDFPELVRRIKEALKELKTQCKQ